MCGLSRSTYTAAGRYRIALRSIEVAQLQQRKQDELKPMDATTYSIMLHKKASDVALRSTPQTLRGITMLKPRPERGIAAENAGFAVCDEDVWCKPSLGKSLAGEVICKDSGAWRLL